MENEKILTDEEIQKNKDMLINNISKVSLGELTQYDIKKPRKQNFWVKIKKILGL